MLSPRLLADPDSVAPASTVGFSGGSRSSSSRRSSASVVVSALACVSVLRPQTYKFVYSPVFAMAEVGVLELVH